jgi:hypothetical protein
MRKILVGLAAALAAATLAPVPARAQEAAAEARANPARRLTGSYSFLLKPAVSFAPWYDGTNGKNSGVVDAPRQDILRVGTFTSDGRGHITGHTIATTDDGLTTVVINFTWTATYTVSSDDTGHMHVVSVNVDDASCTPAQTAGTCATFEGPEDYAFVINTHGAEKLVSLIQTDNNGGGAKIFLAGEARRR